MILIVIMAQWVKNPPAMKETQKMWVQSLGREDPLEDERATHSSILAWEIPWTEVSGRLQPKGLQRIRHSWVTKHSKHKHTTFLDKLTKYKLFKNHFWKMTKSE